MLYLLEKIFKIRYIIYDATIMIEPGQSWKTAALRSSYCVRLLF